MVKKRKLTDKQRLFVGEYLVDLNAKQSAIRAGYSPRTAEWIGPQLLKKTHVLEAVLEGMKEREKRTEITQDNVVKELAKLGFYNMADFMTVDQDGYPHADLSNLTRDQSAALVEFAVDEYYEGSGEELRQVKKIKFKLADKRAALVDLGKHLGMFPKKIEVTGKDGGPVEYSDIERSQRVIALLNEARKRRDRSPAADKQPADLGTTTGTTDGGSE